MPKKRTPTKPQKPRKIAVNAQLLALMYTKTSTTRGHEKRSSMATAQYSRDTFGKRMKSIHEFVARLAEMLNPTSNHTWRLDAQYRFHGKPTKLAKRWKSLFNEAIVNLTKLLSGVDPLDPRCPRSLADMLDPDSRHELRLDFKQRKTWQAAS